MSELQKLKSVFDPLVITIEAKWLPYMLNRYADASSRGFLCGDLRILRTLRRSVVDGMPASLDVLPCHPLSEHLAYQRERAVEELEDN